MVKSDAREDHLAGAHYLEVAIHNGRADVLQAAADAGVDLKKVRTMGMTKMTLLGQAAMHGKVACVRFLLEYGVDVNETFIIGAKTCTACELVCVRIPGASTADARARLLEVLGVLEAAGGTIYSLIGRHAA